MTDDIDDRLNRATDAIIQELTRQGLAKALTELNLDISALAKAAIFAADGRVIKFPPPLVP